MVTAALEAQKSMLGQDLTEEVEILEVSFWTRKHIATIFVIFFIFVRRKFWLKQYVLEQFSKTGLVLRMKVEWFMKINQLHLSFLLLEMWD